MTNLFLQSNAFISECGLYRYRLTRTWDEGAEPVVWVMLNPSVADASQDDPTIKRVVGFSRAWGHGGIVVCNLFGWRSTCPEELKTAPDPIGPMNDSTIEAACLSRRVIVAWGACGYWGRQGVVLSILRRLARSVECLKLTKSGEPWHPLFVRADARPFPFALKETP